MNITRHNYEEYFLLYIDNELPVSERKTVEAFVRENPDLEEELTMLRQSVLHPDKKEVFSNKESLLKNPDFINPVNENNYEEYFVLYGDNELSNEENDFVEVFVYKHPQYQQEFELILQAKLAPDTLIAFPDKSRLYRKEKDERIIVMRWWRIAAAAAVILFIGALGWNLFVKPTHNPPSAEQPVAVTDNNNKENNKDTNTTSLKKDEPAVTNITPGKIPAATQPETIAKRKTIKKDVPVIKGSEKEKDQIVESTQKEPKSSNYSLVQTVTPSKNDDVAIQVPKASIKETKAITPIVDVAVGTDKLDKNKLDRNDGGLATYAVNDNNNQTEVLNTSVNNKNKLRGFFRKVTRVVGRTTNLGPDDNQNNKALRIANFEIALK